MREEKIVQVVLVIIVILLLAIAGGVDKASSVGGENGERAVRTSIQR
jgi:competence protein ComGC